ncbi:MAG TPA: SDR family NAD(P)-dependent oxidoreductase [Acidimicrobiales bacterium]|nr:SDR family NAD(P)-dependent oxidoreductase [Acidimicrobiales bacterium]
MRVAAGEAWEAGMQDFAGKVAVVTGGASGIGEGMAEALLGEGATVVLADIEAGVLDDTLKRLGHLGTVSAVVTDVSDPDSVEACARQVYESHGACHLLFNNAGVGGGGVAKPWNWTPNDWKWCFGVNVFGVGHCVASFVPRMMAGGEEGWIVNTSSTDGGFQPLPDLGVYAASKAALTSYTECLANSLINEGTRLRASVFYPGGDGLLETRLWNSGRNRPPELAREHPHVDQQWDYQEVKGRILSSGGKVSDLVGQGRIVLDGIRAGRFVIGLDTASGGELLRERAERIGRGELPTVQRGGVFD